MGAAESLGSRQQALTAAVAAGVFLGLAARERRLRREAEKQACDLQGEVARGVKLRDEERRGRTRAEQRLREGFAAAAAAGGEGGDEEQGGGAGFVFNPIGHFKSCYRNRCGTPRQGGIVNEALAVLHCEKDLNPVAALEGFSQFSHCWVLYVFHENTNLTREGRTSARRGKTKGRVPLWQGLCMKVAPPRCPDRNLRVGVLACRTPHRPNPVGLSLARIVRVDAHLGQVVLAGLDVVDGTPCLDLKPYMPAFESIPSALVPDWVQASHEEPLMQVTWSAEAQRAFAELLRPKGEAGAGPRIDARPFDSADELRRALEGTLALDIRSPVQKERHKHPGVVGAAAAVAEPGAFFTGDLWFHELHVWYSLIPVLARPGEATALVRVDRVEPRPPDAAAPGGSGK